jgi:phosphatidylglycerophosphatase A
MKMFNKLFSTFFGVGFCPKAPGTAASAVAVVVYALAVHSLPWPWYLLFLVVLFFLGRATSSAYAAELGEEDPRRVVIDEALGQFLALFLVPVRWAPMLLAFGFFRFFDIIKPYPIRQLEKFPGGWGIMADDAAAGLVSAALVHVLLLWI